MNISQWFRSPLDAATSWMRRALCRSQWDLPWTSDIRPDEAELVQMRVICVQCPVRPDCAAYALHSGPNGKPAEGGFYAGHWLPWPTSGEGRHARKLRLNSRSQLRRMAGE